MRQPTYIMIHHSLTEDSQTVSWPAIEKYHKETQHWKDIGYHAGVEVITDNPELDKYKFQALIGRGVEEFAAACPQGAMNVLALHVCCVGNFDIVAPPTELILTLLNRVLIPWSKQYSIPVDRWVGHRDYNPAKSCPGKLFDLEHVRDLGRSMVKW